MRGTLLILKHSYSLSLQDMNLLLIYDCSVFQMDFTLVPTHLDWTQRLILERGSQECWHLLPEHEFCSAISLVDALAQAFFYN